MAEERKNGDKDGIKIVDRRKFTSAGELREDLPEEPERAVGETGDPGQSEEGERRADSGAGFERKPVEEPPGVDFTMLVNAMATQALLLLGEIPDRSGKEPEVHLEQARLQIDMLDLIRVKCRGNLTAVEEKLIEEVLYQLRMRFVAKTGTSGE